ncbi:hypothetical protein BSKO_12516 [Bryopsis sp. KO-2023]|nr:hypothetical protein BSKO_12516 [Bryopsis sp. KO-2023]
MDFTQLFGDGFGSQPQLSQPEVENTPPRENSETPSVTLRALHSTMILQAIGDDPDFDPDALEIDGERVTNIVMVGKLMELSDGLASIQLTILDDLGEFPIRMWKSEGGEEGKDLKKGGYVRVHGSVKNEKEKPILIAFSIRPIDDYGMIVYHSLEVIQQHLIFTEGPLEEENETAQGNEMVIDQEGSQKNSMLFATPIPNRGGDLSHLSPMSIVGTPNDASNSNNLLENVKAVFKDDQSEVGLHIDEIVEKIGGKHPKGEVKKTLEWLVTEGIIYTTTTEEHYQWCG